MTIPLTVDVYCQDCIIDTDDFGSNSDIQMNTEGPLYFNSETRTQAQHYKCPICGHEIAVTIGIERTE